MVTASHQYSFKAHHNFFHIFYILFKKAHHPSLRLFYILLKKCRKRFASVCIRLSPRGPPRGLGGLISKASSKYNFQNNSSIFYMILQVVLQSVISLSNLDSILNSYLKNGSSSKIITYYIHKNHERRI